ncbi:MAG: bifunctional DNA-formamidopyrimidine glycosylase/DNA-(apurinic or apyrimidinic site) lyase [Thermodesulfobacteriota bacterium]
MPELPEVETIARELCAGLSGRRITAVTLRRPASVDAGAPALSRTAFREQVPGLVVVKVWRRAKILLMDLAAVVTGDPTARAAGAAEPGMGRKGGDSPRDRGCAGKDDSSSSTAAAAGASAAGGTSAADAQAGRSGKGAVSKKVLPSSTAAAMASSAAGPASAADAQHAGAACLPAAGRKDASAQFPAAAAGESAAGGTSAADAPSGAVLHLAVRLGMSGRLWLAAPGAEPEKHTHVIFDLDDGRRLFFTDPRTFGSVRAMPGGRLAAWSAFAALGPEPLEIGPAGFAARFAGRSGKMKALLLDQTVVAGVGNIYADESLFRAGISPEARADKVSEARLHRLHAALSEVLAEAIAANGSSIRDYRDAHGDAGAFQNAFRAYGRHGQPCLTCGTTLTKVTVAGRTTTYCRKCQKG